MPEQRGSFDGSNHGAATTQKIMKTEIARKHIQSNIASDDSLIGFFYAAHPFKWWLFFLVGPIAIISVKYLFVAVTKNGLAFHRLNFFGRFSGSDFFSYEEIAGLKIGKGLMRRPMKFHFTNGRSLKINAQIKGVASVAKMSASLQKHIESSISSAK